ncbi:MAG: ATP-dependent Clp protease ATP-binding subunit ClpC [Bacillariaceae sp.]|jgi:ATP-dependent Clp protease ATP-binding subunit ClpC
MVLMRSKILLAGTTALLLLCDDPFFSSCDDNNKHTISKFGAIMAFSSPAIILTSPTSDRMSSASSFVGRVNTQNNKLPKMTTTKKTRSSSRTTGLTMVIDRMSNECVAGIQKAHEIGNSIGLETLQNEILFCGMVAHPERAARTLERYKIDNFEEVEASAIRTLQFTLPSFNYDPNNIDNNNNESTNVEPLPFSDESRILLTKACLIADRMESPTVRSEHVILALLGYNNKMKIETVPVMDLLRTIPALKQVNRDTGGFSVTQFCTDLVNALPMTPVSDSGDDLVVRDTVVVGGSESKGGSTNTLNDVGVDMTQMALDGKLDMVFGRDQEIRSALRTLGRRRKNNPCLIGDPGVGKVR